MRIVCPVTYAASSETRNATAAATSSGRPNRRTAIASRSASPCSRRMRSDNGVSMTPGAMAFAVMPLRPS